MHTIFATILLAAGMLQPKLVDQTGHVFTFASLRGESVAVAFVSAHCTDACPLIDAQLSAASVALARAHAKLRLLTITLDPERDSLADMRRLARTFSADPRYWLIAGGDRADVHAVMGAFGVIVRRGADGYADMHSTIVYLLDARGVYRKAILPSSNLADQLLEEARRDGAGAR